MKQTITILLAILTLNLTSCNNKQITYTEVKDIVVSGKIINYNKHRDPNIIKLTRRDLFENYVQINSQIDDDGLFHIAFPSYFAQEFALKYDISVNLICNPGDSIFLEINVDEILKKSSIDDIIKFPDNILGKTNNEVQKFRDELVRKDTCIQDLSLAVQVKPPREFLSYMNLREKEYSILLDDFIKKNKPTKLFSTWANDYIKYSTLSVLLMYPWANPMYNGIPRDSLELPCDYFSFLNLYDTNDQSFYSTSHFDFIHEYSMYTTIYPKNLRSKYQIAFNEKRPEDAFAIQKEMIAANVSDYTYELLITKLYFNILKAKKIEVFERVYDPLYTSQPYFLSVINDKFDSLKEYISFQKTDNAKLSSIKSNTTDALIDSIISRYSQKIIYMDFWAPWCSPCMLEMPYSKELQTKYDNKDVIFLFLANRCTDDVWRSTIANEKLTGEHILLTDDQYSSLASALNINGIPHYVLIDKDGFIVFKNAPRPTEMPKLIDEIDKLLK